MTTHPKDVFDTDRKQLATLLDLSPDAERLWGDDELCAGDNFLVEFAVLQNAVRARVFERVCDASGEERLFGTGVALKDVDAVVITVLHGVFERGPGGSGDGCNVFESLETVDSEIVINIFL